MEKANDNSRPVRCETKQNQHRRSFWHDYCQKGQPPSRSVGFAIRRLRISAFAARHPGRVTLGLSKNALGKRKPMAADNKLKNGGTGRIMKSCRAYFQFSDASAAREFVLNFGDGEATGITTTDYTDAAAKADGWFTVDGVKRSVEPTRKGLYIQNGKKVVIK